MTTPYAVSTNIGSMSYNNYVNAPITGPLSTNQTPCQIPYHSYGTLTGIRPTPPQFYPSQEPVYADMNTNARHQYLRTSVSNQQLQQQIALGKASPPLAYVINSSQIQIIFLLLMALYILISLKQTQSVRVDTRLLCQMLLLYPQKTICQVAPEVV